MDDTEQDHVGSKGPGAPTFDRLTGAIDKLFERYRKEFGSGEKVVRVAFVDVINRSRYELAEIREQLFDVIATKVNKFPDFETLSPSFVGAVLKEARLTPEQLYIPRFRRQFVEALEGKKSPVDCLLTASVTNMPTRAAKDVKQENYRMTIDLVDLASGRNLMESELVRKVYTK